MDDLFLLAEELRKELRNPYLGSEHLFLAYLKLYPSCIVSFDEYKNHIIKIIGKCSKECDYTLYTPIARDIKETVHSVLEFIDYIIKNRDCIAYNLLLSMGIDPELFNL